MIDRPILFSAPMVRALLDGRKTQTRRVIDFPGIEKVIEFVRMGFDKATGVPFYEMKDAGGRALYRPAGKHLQTPHYWPRFAVGDRLWVREAWGYWPAADSDHREDGVIYRATDDDWECRMFDWRPSIHMPRWASRLTLIVTDVRVQRLQEISEADSVAEGVERDTDGWLDYLMPGTQCCGTARESFRTLWDSLNASRGYGWDANPWVVALTFRVIKQNIDQIAEAA